MVPPSSERCCPRNGFTFSVSLPEHPETPSLEGGKSNFRDVQLPGYPTAPTLLCQHSRLGACREFWGGNLYFSQQLLHLGIFFFFFLIPWNHSGFAPLEMKALLGLKSRSQPSPGILFPGVGAGAEAFPHGLRIPGHGEGAGDDGSRNPACLIQFWDWNVLFFME